MNFSAWSFGRVFGNSRWLRVWTAAWGLLAVVHVTQSIWLSLGEKYPGGLGDGRFNQLLLEHGHQSLRGMATWDSPGQFYPAKHTLAYSDTHAGTLPIYTVARRLGISREEAWQLWFVVVASLNVAAAFRFFRTLEISDALLGPLVFGSAGSATMTWIAGTHMQMLPIFPALLAWEQCIGWCKDRGRWRIPAAIGWLSWQFAAGPYSAFFAVVIAGFVGAARAMRHLRPSASVVVRPPQITRRAEVVRWCGAIFVFVAGAFLAVVVMRVYAVGMRAGHSRSLPEIIEGAPPFAAWFTANPMSLWYPSGWPGKAANVVEHAWFAGFISWILLMAAVVGWRSRRTTPRTDWMFALAFGSLATLLFFTKWTPEGSSLWVTVAAYLEPVRAFRSAGRVAGLLQFTIVGAGGLWLTQRIMLRRARFASTAAVVAACLLATENLTHHQPATSIAEVRARTNALVQAWRQAGDRPILAFAPGFTNQSDTWMFLDAWGAALQLHRACIDGYSGGLPSTHTRFAWNPTVENVRDLIQALGIPENDVSIVETLGAEAERRLGYQRLPERQLTWLADFDLQPVGWSIFAPLEKFAVDGKTMYQFTPPAAVRFALPGSATLLSFDYRMRDGSYRGSCNSDGVVLICLLRDEAGNETELLRRYLNPRDEPQDRGTQHFEFHLSPGTQRTFILRIDPGPMGDNSWDWPLFGALRVK